MFKFKKMLAVGFGLVVGASNLVCFVNAQGNEPDSNKSENQVLSSSLGSLVKTDSVLKNENGEFLLQSNRSFSRSKTMSLTLNSNKTGSSSPVSLGFLDSYFLAEYIACVLAKGFNAENDKKYSDEVGVNVCKGCFNRGKSFCYKLFLEFPVREDFKNEFEAYIDRFKTDDKVVGERSLKDLVANSLSNLNSYKDDLVKILSKCSEKLSSFVKKLEDKKNSLSADAEGSDLFSIGFLPILDYDEDEVDVRVERLNKKIKRLNKQNKIYNDMRDELSNTSQNNFSNVKQYINNLLEMLSDEVSTGFCEMSSVSQVVTPKQSG